MPGTFGRCFRKARIVGVGATQMGRLGKSSTQLMQEALSLATLDAGISKSALDGIVCVPSMSNPHFMEAHHFATKLGLVQKKPSMVVRTIDTGGAGPISALLEARRMVESQMLDCVAVVAADAVLSLDSATFLRRADDACQNEDSPLPTPVIPHGYDLYAQWHMKEYSVRREHLAMASVCMSHNAWKHPLAMCRKPYTLSQVLASRSVAPVTSLLECARRADGGGALVVASTRFMRQHCGDCRDVVILGGGEGSGPLFPQTTAGICEAHLSSCEAAISVAFEETQLRTSDIDFFGLYDCFPIALIRAIEAAGICGKGEGHFFIEDWHKRVAAGSCEVVPVNTHGGLLAYGAPWESPAVFNVVEAVEQLTDGVAANRRVPACNRALVYGNGGIFSASAAAILARSI